MASMNHVWLRVLPVVFGGLVIVPGTWNPQ
jgi:hypothetical protein